MTTAKRCTNYSINFDEISKSKWKRLKIFPSHSPVLIQSFNKSSLLTKKNPSPSSKSTFITLSFQKFRVIELQLLKDLVIKTWQSFFKGFCAQNFNDFIIESDGFLQLVREWMKVKCYQSEIISQKKLKAWKFNFDEHSKSFSSMH